MTIRSMTGFARARRPLGSGEISVTVRSVNHRGLDIHVRAPDAAGPFEAAVRALVKSHIARGHVEVRIAIHETGGAGGLALNRGMLDQYLRAFREIASEHHLEAAPDPNSALRIPGMFGATADESGLLEGAEPVYRLLGSKGLDGKHYPEPGQLLDTPLGYYIRPGKHAMTAGDWQVFLAFADKHFGVKKSP